MGERKEKKRRRMSFGTRTRMSWVLDLANLLMDEHGFGRSDALTTAHATWDLLEVMGIGHVEFTYIKDDGSVRKAIGTLCPELIPEDKKSKGDKDPRKVKWPRVEFSYYDLEKQGWRTFKASGLVLKDKQKRKKKRV